MRTRQAQFQKRRTEEALNGILGGDIAVAGSLNGLGFGVLDQLEHHAVRVAEAQVGLAEVDAFVGCDGVAAQALAPVGQ